MLSNIKRMLAYLLPYKWQFAIGQVAMLIATAAGLAFPWAIRGIFDTLFTAQDVRLWSALGFLTLVFLVQETANYVKTYALGYIGQRMIRDMRDRVYHQLLAMSLDYYSHHDSGAIASSLSNDMNLLQEGLSSGLTLIVQQAVSLVAVIILMLKLDPVLTLAVIAAMPPVIAISKKVGEQVRVVSARTQERLSFLMSIIQESIAGIDIIKAYLLENYAFGLFRRENDQIMARSVERIKIGAGARLLIGLLNSCFLLLVIGLGGYRVATGALTPADLIAFILYSEMVAGPVATLAGVYVEINKAVAAFERLTAILDAPGEVRNAPDAITLDEVRGHVEFRHVTFAYKEGRPVLHDVSFELLPGETVALVGPSGVGKSTLSKLIPRFYDPDAGAVLLDGVDIRRLDLDFLRSQIAIVPQDPYLFGLSIRDNIACGRPDATDEEIVHAAKLANAHEFIVKLEKGYHTEIGERGARLSGGQRQRIAIARAFLKNPRILILDEATSALDAFAESKVQSALGTLMKGRTTLIIAHRLSTIENADKIVVLKEGRVTAVGTHKELLTSSPFYRELYKRQFKLDLPRPIPITSELVPTPG